MTTRGIVAIIVRLSIVCGIGIGGYDAFRTLEAWNDAAMAYNHNNSRIKCAAGLSDQWIARNSNAVGTVDVAPICGAGDDGKTFFTNASEIEMTRKGEDIYAFMLWRKPYDLPRSLIAAASGFVGALLVGLAMLVAFHIFRWVAYGTRR